MTTIGKFALLAAAIGLFVVLLGRAVDIEHGDARCSSVTIAGQPFQPVSWQPSGWRVEDGYTSLRCPVQGRWYHLNEDGSISPS